MTLSGDVLLDGEEAPDGIQVALLMKAGSQECWSSPVLTKNGRYALAFSPPDSSGAWFPLLFYVDGWDAVPSFVLDVVQFSPGGSFPINLDGTTPPGASASGSASAPSPDIQQEPLGCPAAAAAVGIPALPMFISGFATLDGATPADGTQVFALMRNLTVSEALRDCWTNPVTTTSGAFTLSLAPPDSKPSWFPVIFYVGGWQGEPSRPVEASDFSPGDRLTMVDIAATTPGG